MSERAALRLEHLGFHDVHRYAAGKADWTAAGLPRGGKSAGTLSSGDAMTDDVATCHFRATAPQAMEDMHRGEHNYCVAVDDARVVLGLLPLTEAEQAGSERAVVDVMRPGPYNHQGG
jgi:hypothetical protein